MRSVSILILALAAQPARALSLDEYLTQVQEKNGLIKSLGSSKEASQAKRIQGDLSLSPKLTAKAHQMDDRKPTVFSLPAGSLVIPKVSGSEYSLGLSKKFTSGTEAGVTGSMTNIGQYIPDGSGGYITPQSYGAIELSLSQNLWKDFFGNATQLRQEREALVEKSEIGNYDLQARQVLIEAESALWDYIYLKEELQQREQSLERAKKIEGWVRGRAGNGIGDRADVLNAQGLVAVRELSLLGTKDDLRAAEEKLRTTLELSGSDKTPDISADLQKLRPVESMTSGTGSKVVKLDSYLAALEAKAKTVGAREAEDSTKPELVLEGKYRTNSNDNSWGVAASKITDTSQPSTDVSIRFVYQLDGNLKENARKMARMEALAATQKKERKLLESESSWLEFIRRHSELSKKIQAAEKASQIQTSKAAAERDKLSKGRSITSQVITAEQDAAETTLTLAKLRAEQRKLEAQARMYVQLQEVP